MAKAVLHIYAEFRSKRGVQALARAMRLAGEMEWSPERERLERCLRIAAKQIKARVKSK